MIEVPWPVPAIETEKRRLEVLRRLFDTPGYQLHEDLLCAHCVREGVPTTSEQMAAALAWLSREELISTRTGQDRTRIACLTRLGAEVAQGFARVPGVWRPSP